MTGCRLGNIIAYDIRALQASLSPGSMAHVGVGLRRGVHKAEVQVVNCTTDHVERWGYVEIEKL